MSKDASIRVTIDSALGTAYIRLSMEPVARTAEITEDVLVDLDALGVAVGVEVLSLGADIPFTQLLQDCHVHSDVVGLLNRIRPTVHSFVVSASSEASSRVPAAVVAAVPVA